MDFIQYKRQEWFYLTIVNFSSADVWLALFTLFYVDILDTTGTLYSMASFQGLLDKKGNFEGSTMAFTTDAIGTIVASLMGTPETTTYIESAAGIQEGGKTGITAIVIAFLFFISLFFTPILASIPPWATGPALIIVGCIMCKNVKNINWNDISESVPSFICIILMPLTYSIAYGIIGGLFMFVVIKGTNRLLDLLCPCCKKYDNQQQIVKNEKNDENHNDIETVPIYDSDEKEPSNDTI